MIHYSEQRDQEETLRLRRLNSGAAEVHFHLANAVNELKMAMALLGAINALRVNYLAT